MFVAFLRLKTHDVGKGLVEPKRKSGVVQVGDAAEGTHPPFAEGQTGYCFAPAGKVEQHSAHDKLEYQHKGHDRHGGGGVRGRRGDHQPQHIRAAAEQQHRDEILRRRREYQPLCPASGKEHPRCRDYPRLDKTDQKLPKGVSSDICAKQHTRAVLRADDIMLPADALYRVENAYPDRRRGKGEKARLGAFVVGEHIPAHHRSHRKGDHKGKNDELPVMLLQGYAVQLAEIDPGLEQIFAPHRSACTRQTAVSFDKFVGSALSAL